MVTAVAGPALAMGARSVGVPYAEATRDAMKALRRVQAARLRQVRDLVRVMTRRSPHGS